MWRDKRVFMRLHLVAAYNGPLSDIYLAAHRPSVRFRINRQIREGRRVFWLAAMVVQARLIIRRIHILYTSIYILSFIIQNPINFAKGTEGCWLGAGIGRS